MERHVGTKKRIHHVSPPLVAVWICASGSGALIMSLCGVEKSYVGITLTVGLCGPMLFFTMVLYIWLRSLISAVNLEREPGEVNDFGIPRICQSLRSTMIYACTALLLLSASILLTVYSHSGNRANLVWALICLFTLCLLHTLMPILFLDLAVIHGILAAVSGVQCVLLMLCSSQSFLTWIPSWIAYALVVISSLVSAFGWTNTEKKTTKTDLFATIPRVISTKAQKLTLPFISLFCCIGHVLVLKHQEKIGTGFFLLAFLLFAVSTARSLVRHLDTLIDEVMFTEPRAEKEPLLPDG